MLIRQEQLTCVILQVEEANQEDHSKQQDEGEDGSGAGEEGQALCKRNTHRLRSDSAQLMFTPTPNITVDVEHLT